MKTALTIDIADWVEEYQQREPTIQGDNDIVRLTQQGMGTGQVARLTVVARANGLAPEGILKSDKLLLYSGARAEIDVKHAARMRMATMPNGVQYQVREFVGAINTLDEEGEPVADNEDDLFFVRSDSEDGLRRVRRYLFAVVPGHIFNRLKILAANDEDIDGVCDMLHDMIDQQRAKVMEEPEKEAEPAV